MGLRDRRGTESPMEYTYTQGVQVSGPLLDALQRQSSTSSIRSSQSSTSRQSIFSTPQSYPPGVGFSRYNPGSHSARATPVPDLPGTYTPATPIPEVPELSDVTMSSVDDASPLKDVVDPPTKSPPAESEDGSPLKGKEKRQSKKFAGIVRRLLGKSKKGSDTPASAPTTPRRRRSSDTAVGEEDEREVASHVGTYNVVFPHPNALENNLPQQIWNYARVSFLVVVLAFVLFLVWTFFSMVRDDVEAKLEEYSSELLHEIKLCSELYLTNRCHPNTRVPAMEQMCQEWERCIHKDPKVVSRVRVWAETLGEMFNGFVEPIAWKTLAFTVILLFSVTFATWGIFRLFGSVAPSKPPSLPHTPSYPMLLGPRSPTPSLNMNGAPLSLEAPYSPYSPYPPPEWVRAWSEGPGSLPQTPQRRRP